MHLSTALMLFLHIAREIFNFGRDTATIVRHRWCLTEIHVFSTLDQL